MNDTGRSRLDTADRTSLQERRGPAIRPTRQVGLEALASHSVCDGTHPTPVSSQVCRAVSPVS